MSYEKKVVVFNLDGTIADPYHRMYFIDKEPKRWEDFYAACGYDNIIEPMVRLLITLGFEYEIVYCTTRPESSRDETVAWLRNRLPRLLPVQAILMRANKDDRLDVIVKPELLKNAGYTPKNVMYIVEKQKDVVEKFRKLGFTVLQYEMEN